MRVGTCEKQRCEVEARQLQGLGRERLGTQPQRQEQGKREGRDHMVRMRESRFNVVLPVSCHSGSVSVCDRSPVQAEAPALWPGLWPVASDECDVGICMVG